MKAKNLTECYKVLQCGDTGDSFQNVNHLLKEYFTISVPDSKSESEQKNIQEKRDGVKNTHTHGKLSGQQM